MQMPSSLLGEAAPDFSDPIGLLEACHGRIEQNCALLQRMCDHQDTQGADADLAAAAQTVMRYFDIAAPLHHADEEQDLFPALAGEADLQQLIRRLQTEHAEHEMLWQTLRTDLERLVGGHAAETLRAHAQPFIAAYRQHADIENQQILTRARQVLGGTTLARIGEAMAQRRRG
jgi:hemerythrin-like domain-containing protein